MPFRFNPLVIRSLPASGAVTRFACRVVWACSWRRLSLAASRAASLAASIASLLAVSSAACLAIHPTAMAQTPESAPAARAQATQQVNTAAGVSVSSAPGEAQAVFLLRMVQDISAPRSSMPLQAFGERVARAATAHPDSLAASAAQRAAIEATHEIEAATRPQISALADASAHRTGVSTIFGNPARQYESASAGLTLRQYLYDFGATRASIEGGRAREIASATRRESRTAELALRAVQTWMELYRSRRLLELTRLNVQARETFVSFLSRRYELGAGLVSDVWRSRSRLAEARAELALATSRSRSGEAAFRELFQAEAGEIELPEAPTLDRAALVADPQAAIVDFPAVRNALALRRAADQEREVARLRARPEVAFEVTAQRRDLVGAGLAGNDASATLTLRYNFYSGGATTSRIGQAGFRAEEAAQQLRSVSAEVERELAQALADDDSSATVLADRGEAVTLAADALRAVREVFSNRRGSLLDLLNAQEVLHAAGLGLIDAQVGQALARWRVVYFSAALEPAIGLERMAAGTAPSPIITPLARVPDANGASASTAAGAITSTAAGASTSTTAGASTSTTATATATSMVPTPAECDSGQPPVLSNTTRTSTPGSASCS